MASKKEISETIKSQFAGVRKRARVLGQGLKARADIAASRRRLRAAFADLGAEVYERMVSGTSTDGADDVLQEFRVRIDGVKAEVRQRERALAEVLARDGAGDEDAVDPDTTTDETGTVDPQ